MKKYTAFLRGINVGNIRIKMADLKSAFEKMGYTQVTTFLQTGNVIFESGQTIGDLKASLEKGLSEAFNYEAYVLVYAFDILNEIIAQYPMERDETHHAHVIFVEGDTVFEALKLQAQGLGEEANCILPGSGVLYWKVKIGASTDTNFAKIVAKPKYKSSVTIRNLQTLEKMV